MMIRLNFGHVAGGSLWRLESERELDGDNWLGPKSICSP